MSHDLVVASPAESLVNRGSSGVTRGQYSRYRRMKERGQKVVSLDHHSGGTFTPQNPRNTIEQGVDLARCTPVSVDTTVVCAVKGEC